MERARMGQCTKNVRTSPYKPTYKCPYKTPHKMAAKDGPHNTAAQQITQDCAQVTAQEPRNATHKTAQGFFTCNTISCCIFLKKIYQRDPN